jgi:hypothetical protein
MISKLQKTNKVDFEGGLGKKKILNVTYEEKDKERKLSVDCDIGGSILDFKRAILVNSLRNKDYYSKRKMKKRDKVGTSALVAEKFNKTSIEAGKEQGSREDIFFS